MTMRAEPLDRRPARHGGATACPELGVPTGAHCPVPLHTISRHHGFRRLAPYLVAAGYQVDRTVHARVCAIPAPTDHAYHLGALMDDALRASCEQPHRRRRW